MNTELQNPPMLLAPSARKLALASGAALAAAAALLLIAVLPAEFGIDPLGTGKALGLLSLSQAGNLEPVPPPQGSALVPVSEGNVALYPGEYKVDSRIFVLGPYEYVEFKYHLGKDAVMLFSWSADGNVLQDFHGDPDGTAAAASESYDKKPRRKSDGMFTAPFSGIHGWYWENAGANPVTIKVTTAGFYTAAHQFTMKNTREERHVRGIEAIPINDK